MKNFAQRIAALPRNRKMTTVLALRELIKDMWNAGWNANAIADAMDRDHTTILHHLWIIGIKPQIRLAERVKARRVIEAEMQIQRSIEKQKRDDELVQIMREKARMTKENEKRVSRDRKTVFRLYKKGYTYKQIFLETGIKPSRVEALMIYHPEWQKMKRIVASRAINAIRPVDQLSLDGKLLRRWKSAGDVERELGIFRNNICMTCKGRTQTCGGFRWRYSK